MSFQPAAAALLTLLRIAVAAGTYPGLGSADIYVDVSLNGSDLFAFAGATLCETLARHLTPAQKHVKMMTTVAG
jgi:hypothetical protein